MASKRRRCGVTGQRQLWDFVDVKHSIIKAIVNELLDKCVNDESQSARLVYRILKDLLLSVVSRTKKHDGNKLSQKTINEWKVNFPWLKFESVCGEMRLSCMSCQQTKSALQLTNVWATEGTPNIQISSIQRHNTSAEHKRAVTKTENNLGSELLAKSGECDNLDSAFTYLDEDKILFNTVYYAAKSECPSDQVNGLLMLQKMNGLDVKYKNLSWITITEIQKSISHVLTQTLVGNINASSVFAIMLDESTDMTVEKRLSICVRYVKGGEAVTSFLCNRPLDDGCAHTIVNCVAAEFENMGIDMSKCVSLSTDGAATMMGKHSGVGKQIQAKYAPFLVQTHCVAHRLNLACVDSIKKLDYLVKFRDKFNALYYFISASSNRTATLKKLQKLLEEPELTIKAPHSIRWLGLKQAVEAVYESYESVLATLSKFAAEKNSVAKGLLKYFANYKVLLVTSMMLDVHTELAVLSCSLQKQNLLFSEPQPLIEGALSKLQMLGTVDGQGLKTMKGGVQEADGSKYLGGEKLVYSQQMEKQFASLREEYLKNLNKNIKSRFRQEDCVIFRDMSHVMEPLTVISVPEEQSRDAITHLGELYGYQKEVKIIQGNMIEGVEEQIRQIQPLLDPQALLDEWPRMRGMIIGSYSDLQPDQLCKRIILLHKSAMPNCAKLAKLALYFQLTSVECERSFSTQNRLKNKFRASLGSEKLDTLLKISMLGPSPETFDPKPAIQHWMRKKRRKARLFCEYKARPAKVKKNLLIEVTVFKIETDHNVCLD